MFYRHVRNSDVIQVFGPVADFYSHHPDWERVISEEEAAELKGASLDEALEEAGLSKSGRADEKRARLAEHTIVDEAEPLPDTKGL